MSWAHCQTLPAISICPFLLPNPYPELLAKEIVDIVIKSCLINTLLTKWAGYTMSALNSMKQENAKL